VSDRRPVTAAFIELLETTGLPIGDHVAPGEVAGKPWAIVYSIPGGALRDDNLAAVEKGTDLVYQVTSVGRRRDQAEWMADRARTTVIARTSSGFTTAWPMMTGAEAADRQLLGGLGGAEPSGKAPHQVWSVAERFLIRLFRT
jgi:hypothetical protein